MGNSGCEEAQIIAKQEGIVHEGKPEDLDAIKEASLLASQLGQG